MHDYRQLQVWRRADELTVAVYGLTARFPNHEMYGLVSQLRRAAASIPSNIAEGSGRRSNREFARYLDIAVGSSTELEYQTGLSARLGYISEQDASTLLGELGEIRGMLHGLVSRLRREHP